MTKVFTLAVKQCGKINGEVAALDCGGEGGGREG
jgi:hypothetical protein